MTVSEWRSRAAEAVGCLQRRWLVDGSNIGDDAEQGGDGDGAGTEAKTFTPRMGDRVYLGVGAAEIILI